MKPFGQPVTEIFDFEEGSRFAALTVQQTFLEREKSPIVPTKTPVKLLTHIIGRQARNRNFNCRYKASNLN